MLDMEADDITEGPLLRSLLVLAAPLVFQNFVLAAQQVIDLFWVGRLSADGVAALGLAYPIIGVLYALGLTLPMIGTQVVVSQRVGGDAAPGEAYSTAVIVGIGVAALAGGAMVVAVDPLVDLVTSTRPGPVAGNVPTLTVRYLTVLSVGLPLMVITEVVEAGYVGWGDSRGSLYINVASVVVNAILDPILIFGWGPVPRLEIVGAALGTVLSTVLAGGFGLAMIAAGRNGGMLPEGITFDVDTMREIVDVGAPTAGQRLIQQVAGIGLVVLVFTAGGATAVAGYVVGLRVLGFAYIPAYGLQRAIESTVGQNLGADNVTRARRATWLGAGIATGGLLVVGVLQWVFAGAITDFVAPTIGPAREVAITFLHVIAIGYPGVGAMYLLEGGFNGARRTRVSFVAGLFQHWVFRIPLGALAIYLVGGAEVVFWVITVSNVGVAIGLAWYYRHSVEQGMLKRATTAVE